MKNRIILSVVLAALFFCSACSGPKTEVLVIGGSASGVAAGIQSARLGAKTIILEEHLWLGGMLTSAGVSAVDGNYRMPAGIFGEFRDSLVALRESGGSGYRLGKQCVVRTLCRCPDIQKYGSP